MAAQKAPTFDRTYEGLKLPRQAVVGGAPVLF